MRVPVLSRSAILPPWKAALLGAIAICALPGFYSVWIAPRLLTGNLLAESSRMIEGGATALLTLNALMVGLLLAVRLPRAAFVQGVLVALAIFSLSSRTAAVSQPLTPGPEAIRLVWWNIYGSNPRPPAQLAATLRAQQADLILVGEASPLRPVLADLKADYPYQLGCGPKLCDMLILSRWPLQAAQPWLKAPYLGSPGWVPSERLAVVQVDTPQGPLTVVGLHLTKAWYGSAHRQELFKVHEMLKRLSGPLVLVGDLNAPPWGGVLAKLTQDSRLHRIQPAPATWPARLNDFGIAIDHILVRDEAGISAIDSFASDLGSNHRGLVATMTLR